MRIRLVLHMKGRTQQNTNLYEINLRMCIATPSEQVGMDIPLHTIYSTFSLVRTAHAAYIARITYKARTRLCHAPHSICTAVKEYFTSNLDNHLFSCGWNLGVLRNVEDGLLGCYRATCLRWLYLCRDSQGSGRAI